MNGYTRFAIVLFVTLCSSAAGAFTLTFDEVPAGSNPSYYAGNFAVNFHYGFEIVNHTASSWGTPYSGSNVMIWSGYDRGIARITFGHYTPSSADPEYMSYLGAYFSTAPGIVVRMVAHDGSSLVASTLIGASDASWNNTYVGLIPSSGRMDSIDFEAVSSPGARLGFCIDDMTLTPVPEPASILALTGGLGSLFFIRRKR